MNAKPLFTEDKKDTVAYFCSECRIVKSTFEIADKCCTTPLCDCGGEVEHRRSKCRPCSDKNTLDKLKARLSKATRIKTPTTIMVHSDETSHHDGFFDLADIEEVFDDSEMPLYVYDCDKQHWKGLCYDTMIENALEGDWYDEASENVVLEDEFKTFLDEWNKKQTLHQFTATLNRIIVLDDDKFNAWLAE